MDTYTTILWVGICYPKMDIGIARKVSPDEMLLDKDGTKSAARVDIQTLSTLHPRDCTQPSQLIRKPLSHRPPTFSIRTSANLSGIRSIGRCPLSNRISFNTPSVAASIPCCIFDSIHLSNSYSKYVEGMCYYAAYVSNIVNAARSK